MNKDAYTRYFIGKGVKGADEYGYSTRWNSTTEGLVPTSYFKSGSGDKICCYCGNEMLPIQQKNDYLHEGYETTGYCCVCKDAEKEVTINKKIKELKEKMESQLWELEKKIPKANYKKLNTHIQNVLKNHKDDWFDESFYKEDISYKLHIEGQEEQ